jgi:Cdc6-like AAA superfamily ATPase
MDKAISGRAVRKLTCFELVERIIGRLRSSRLKPIIALDNFDRVDGIEELLWDLQGIMYKTLRTLGLILISTDKYDLPNLVGDRLYSRLRPVMLYFKPYDVEILAQILKERMMEAYGMTVMSKDALMKIAEFVEANGGNVRLMFEMFLESAEIAQRDGLKRIGINAVKDVLRSKEEGLKGGGDIAGASS